MTNDQQQQQKLTSLEIGSHILAIYDNKKAKFDYAFQFLKAGLDNNEVVMIITDDLSKEEIRNRMKEEWHLMDVDSLEDSKDIIIKSTKEWYYPEDKVNPNRISALWYALSELATIRKKKGLRVFGDTYGFFQDGCGEDLIRYETTLDKKFDVPVTALCAYESATIGEPEKKKMITMLHEHHGHIWHHF